MTIYTDAKKLFYARFMDDWIILCKSRHQLRQVVALMNRVLEKLKVSKHPFKTYIGRIKESGFDFLGYRILPGAAQTLRLAWSTWVNHCCKLRQLYEQGASEGSIGEYVRRWRIWVGSGLAIDVDLAVAGFERHRGFDGLGFWGLLKR